MLTSYFAFGSSSEASGSSKPKDDRDYTARIIGFSGLLVAACKWVWDIWQDLERTKSTVVCKNFSRFGNCLGIEVYNLGEKAIYIKSVKMTIKVSNRNSEEVTFRTGENADKTECRLEEKTPVEFFYPASLASHTIENVYISVETPAGRIEFINEKKIREALAKC